MANATDKQVQAFVSERIRPRAQQIRALLLAMEDDKSVIDDVYAALSNSPTWTDDRSDGPPHLLTPSDVLGWNAFVTDIIVMMRAHGQLPTVLKACVHPV